MNLYLLGAALGRTFQQDGTDGELAASVVYFERTRYRETTAVSTRRFDDEHDRMNQWIDAFGAKFDTTRLYNALNERKPSECRRVPTASEAPKTKPASHMS